MKRILFIIITILFFAVPVSAQTPTPEPGFCEFPLATFPGVTYEFYDHETGIRTPYSIDAFETLILHEGDASELTFEAQSHNYTLQYEVCDILNSNSAGYVVRVESPIGTLLEDSSTPLYDNNCMIVRSPVIAAGDTAFIQGRSSHTSGTDYDISYASISAVCGMATPTPEPTITPTPTVATCETALVPLGHIEIGGVTIYTNSVIVNVEAADPGLVWAQLSSIEGAIVDGGTIPPGGLLDVSQTFGAPSNWAISISSGSVCDAVAWYDTGTGATATPTVTPPAATQTAQAGATQTAQAGGTPTSQWPTATPGGAATSTPIPGATSTPVGGGQTFVPEQLEIVLTLMAYSITFMKMLGIFDWIIAAIIIGIIVSVIGMLIGRAR